MERIDIMNTINSFLAEEFEVDSAILVPDASIKDTLELDSLDFVDLVVLVEKHFGLKMSAEEFKQIPTFNDFYNYVAQKLLSKIEADTHL